MKGSRLIPVSRPLITHKDIQSVQKAVSSTFIAGGKFIPEFEKALANYCGRRFGVAVTNATSALYLAVKALSLPSKSKILIPAFTIVSVLHAVLQNGHTPDFVDVDPETWNVSLSSVKRSLIKGIKAAIIPETFSSSPLMDQIQSLLKKNNIPLIEDAAEGFGGSCRNKPFGSFGEMSILSFYANKLISTGEGGMILTDNKSLYERLTSLRNLCFDRDRKFIHQELSGNYRLTNIQAALGLSQFNRIHSMYQHRKRLYQIYLENLNKNSNKYFAFQKIPPQIKSSYWVFPVLLQNFSEEKTLTLMNKLFKKGIESRHFFYPLNKQPFLAGNHKFNSVSLDLYNRGIYLPLGNGVSEKEVRTSAKILLKLLREYS